MLKPDVHPKILAMFGQDVEAKPRPTGVDPAAWAIMHPPRERRLPEKIEGYLREARGALRYGRGRWVQADPTVYDGPVVNAGAYMPHAFFSQGQVSTEPELLVAWMPDRRRALLLGMVAEVTEGDLAFPSRVQGLILAWEAA